MNRIFKRFKTRNTFLILFVLAYNSLLSQSNTISQAIDPHVFMDVDTWETHIGDLSINEVMHGDSVVWEMETLNKPFWEKEGVKWFRQEVILPKKFEGLDVVLHIHTSPSAEVYINGLRSFIASGYSGKGILSFAAKAGEIKTEHEKNKTKRTKTRINPSKNKSELRHTGIELSKRDPC